MTRAPFVIGLKRYQAGPVDRYNNSKDTWAAPVNVNVYSVEPVRPVGSSVETYTAGRSSVTTVLSVLAPSGTQISRKDRVIYQGEEYLVNGEITDWSKSPFNTGLLWDAGIQIFLKRAEG